MPVNYISDYIVINQGGTPGTAGTGSYFVASLGDVFEPALASAASADPTTLTAYEGSIIWHAGAPFIWNGTGYEPVRASGAAAGDDARLQVAATAPALRADGTALVAGDLWVNTTTDAVLVYDGTAYVGGAAGGNSTIVDNGDNTVTHTSGSGAVTTLMKAPSHVAAPAAPATPFVGDTWYDTVNSKLFQRANNGTTDIWVDITASAAASGLDPRFQSSATAPTARGDTTPLAEGDLWYDTAADVLKTYDGAAWQAGGGSVRGFPDVSQTPSLPLSGGANGAFVWANFRVEGGNNFTTNGTITVNGAGGWIDGIQYRSIDGATSFVENNPETISTPTSGGGSVSAKVQIYIPPGGNLEWSGNSSANDGIWVTRQTSLVRGGSL